MKNVKKLISISLAALITLASFPFTAIPALAETLLPTITLAQSVFSTPESSAALTVTASQTSPDQSTASRSVKASTGATGSSVIEGWNYHPYGIRVDKYKYARITYYYDTNSDSQNPGTGNAVGKNMKFLIGYVSTSTGTVLQVSGSNKWFGSSYSSRDTIVANQEATCVIDFSGFYTANQALLSANPTYNVLKQVKWTFFGLSAVDTLNVYDKMYIKKVEFFTYDPENPGFSPVTVTFNAGTGTGTSFTQSFTPYENITFPEKPADFTKTGMRFSGWTYQGAVYAAGASTTFLDDSAVTISAAWEDTEAYVSTDGVIPGYLGTVYTNLNDAVNHLGSGGGTIYIEGDYNFTSTISLPSAARDKLYIKGYGDSSSGGKLYTETKGAQFSVNGGDVEFDNITIGGPGQDETSWFTNGNTLTFGSGVVYTDPSSGSHDLWLAASGTRTASKITVNSSSLQATNVAPVQGYGTTASITGHTLYHLNAGTFANVYGLSRDGKADSSGAKIYGDVNYNIAGGNYSSVLTGGAAGKTTMYGNIQYKITGGQFSGNVQFGGGNANNITGHQAIIVDMDDYRANSADTDGFSIVDHAVQPVSCGKKIAIINHYEIMGESANKVTISSNAEYKLRVFGGKAYPVFESSSTSTSSTTYGALLGFSIIPDTSGYRAFANNELLVPNASGYYDLSAYENTSTSGYIHITFAKTYNLSYVSGLDGASGTAPAGGDYRVGEAAIIAQNGFSKEGYSFVCWTSGGNTYYPGDTFYMPASDTVFTGQWVKLSYVDAVNGLDTNSGLTSSQPVKTLSRAITLLGDDGGRVILLSDITLNGAMGPSHTGMVTVTSQSGSSVITVENQIYPNGSTTFENVAFNTPGYNHFNTYSDKIVFGSGVTKAEGSAYSIMIHAGVNGTYSGYTAGTTAYLEGGVTLEINSGLFAAVAVGGAYLRESSNNNTIAGDVNITVNGGTTSLTLGADMYTVTPPFDPVEFLDNVYYTINGGTVSSITYNAARVRSIGGNYQIILNNGVTVPTLSVPTGGEGIVTGDTIIVRSGTGGKVSHTSTPGSFLIEPDAGKMAVVTNPDSSVSYYAKGTHTFTNGTYHISYIPATVLSSVDLSIELPIPDEAPQTTVSGTGYVATTNIVWSPSVSTVFAPGVQYAAAVTIAPDLANQYVFSDSAVFTINGKTAQTVRNSDGSVSLSYTFDIERVIYVKASGDNSAEGTTKATALLTVGAAYEKLVSTGGTIIILDDAVFGTTTTPGTKMVTITGYDSNAKLTIAASGAGYLRSPTTLKNLILNLGTNAHLNSFGNKIILGENLSRTGGFMYHDGAFYPIKPFVDRVDTTIEENSSVSMYYIGGAYITDTSSGISGDARLTLNGGSITNLRLGFDSYNASHTGGIIGGNVLITVNSGTISSFVQAPRTASIGGALQMIFNNGTSISGFTGLDAAKTTKGKYYLYSTSEGVVSHTEEAGVFKIVPNDPEESVFINGILTLPDSGTEDLYTLTPFTGFNGSFTGHITYEKAITGSKNFTITAPAAGATPQTTVTDGDHFTSGNIIWSGNPAVFSSGTVYTASILLTADTGYVFSDGFAATVNGNAATVVINRDSLTATVSYSFAPTTASAVYVKSTGSDSNNGLTEATAFATVSKAITTLAANGGKVIVCDSVSFSGTMPANAAMITITGEGYPGAQLTLANNMGSIFTGPLKIENIAISNGTSTHYNPRQYNFMIGDGVTGSLPLMHLGAYSTGSSVSSPTISKVDFSMSSGTVSTIFIGGAYIQSTAEGIAGDAKVVINGGTVGNLKAGFDGYLPAHTGGVINGNILITVNGGVINAVSNSANYPLTANGTYQIIFNNGTSSALTWIYPAGISDSEKYIVHSGVGGKVEHALDENGASIDGTFDIIPDSGKIAMISYSGTSTVCRAGRYALPANTEIYVTYVDDDDDIFLNQVKFTGPSVNKEIDAASDALMNASMYSNNLDLSGVTGTIYYVSETGSDSNNGKSTATPWKTLTKVNSAALVSGDVVLFKRGDTFRGQLVCKDGVKYSAYGTPAVQGQPMNKPKIIGSKKNYADPSLWLTTAYPNVYKYNGTLSNVGIVAFDHTGIIPKYDETVGRRKTNGVGGFSGEANLDTDLDFYSNLTTNEFFLYSAEGNPGTRFSSIEIGERADLVEVNFGNVGVTVDNICFMYGGAHGVGTGGRKNLTVTNNVFCWIGGSILIGYGGSDITGYGNAVEIYGGVDGYFVKNNFIYQIYDTGITHQCSDTTTGDVAMNNIQYYDNLILYCHWSIEYYNRNNGTSSRTVTNVDIQGNILRLGGYGWGSITQNRQTGATLFNSFGMSTNAEDVENFVATDNIFDRSMGSIVRLPNTDGDKKVVLTGNTYIQTKGKQLGMIYSASSYYYQYYNAEALIKGLIGDTTAKVYFYAQ